MRGVVVVIQEEKKKTKYMKESEMGSSVGTILVFHQQTSVLKHNRLDLRVRHDFFTSNLFERPLSFQGYNC